MIQSAPIFQERYHLQKKLGRTAASRQTWLATDLQLNEPVIVKLLAFNPQMEWDELKLFEREAEVLQSLQHPRIPRYRDYFCLDREVGKGIPWFGLVQDYIPGFSLQELLEQGQCFVEKQVHQIAIEVLEILRFLHDLQPPVLHRDIKPSNLILAENQNIYLVDFGAVQSQAAVTGMTFTVVGTSGYAPLEQFWGRAVPASDLYALGATLIHLLTGEHPVSLPQKEGKIQFGDRLTISPQFSAWISTLTEIPLDRRFASTKQALEALKSGKVKGNSQSLSKIPKPNKTRIQIQKSATLLELHIPSGGWRRLFEFVSLNGGILLALITIGILILAALDFNASIAYSMILFTIAITCFVEIGLAFTVFFCEKTHLYFRPDTLELERQTLNFFYGYQQVNLNEVLGVFLYAMNRTSKRVSIRFSEQNYFLGNGLTEQECLWLAQEIQDWLNRYP